MVGAVVVDHLEETEVVSEVVMAETEEGTEVVSGKCYPVRSMFFINKRRLTEAVIVAVDEALTVAEDVGSTEGEVEGEVADLVDLENKAGKWINCAPPLISISWN